MFRRLRLLPVSYTHLDVYKRQIDGRGGVTAPDLSNAGSELTVAEMEQSLLKPAARRKPGFEVATVRRRSGSPVRGLLRNESLYDLQVQGFDGRLYLLRRDEVTGIEREASSYMPAVQAGETELRDLIAYLANPPVSQPAGDSVDPVSYTHLDVYKRQQ